MQCSVKVERPVVACVCLWSTTWTAKLIPSIDAGKSSYYLLSVRDSLHQQQPQPQKRRSKARIVYNGLILWAIKSVRPQERGKEWKWAWEAARERAERRERERARDEREESSWWISCLFSSPFKSNGRTYVWPWNIASQTFSTEKRKKGWFISRERAEQSECEHGDTRRGERRGERERAIWLFFMLGSLQGANVHS